MRLRGLKMGTKKIKYARPIPVRERPNNPH
jgi:hypothetical protein